MNGPDQWFSKFFSHSSLTNTNSVNSSPTKITNDNCKNFTLRTVGKQYTIMNQTDSFVYQSPQQLVLAQQLVPASYCDCYLTGAWSPWPWSWLVTAASPLQLATTNGAGYDAWRTVSHRDPSWLPFSSTSPSNNAYDGDWQTVEGVKQRHGSHRWIPPDMEVKVQY